MRAVAVLGSTGSIGRSTLAVLRRQREHFRVVALTAGCNAAELEAQRAEWRPAFVGLAEPAPNSVSQLVASPFVRVLLTLVVG